MYILYFQCMVIIVLVLARTGFNYGTGEFLHNVDPRWLTVTAVVSYTFIYIILIICYLLEEVVPLNLVSYGCIHLLIALSKGSL